MVNFCWSIFKWGLLVGVAGAVIAALFLYQQMDEEIPGPPDTGMPGIEAAV